MDIKEMGENIIKNFQKLDFLAKMLLVFHLSNFFIFPQLVEMI